MKLKVICQPQVFMVTTILIKFIHQKRTSIHLFLATSKKTLTLYLSFKYWNLKHNFKIYFLQSVASYQKKWPCFFSPVKVFKRNAKFCQFTRKLYASASVIIILIAQHLLLKGSSSWSYGSWIYNYLCNQCPSPLALWVRMLLRRGVLDTRLCDKFVSDMGQVGGFLRVLRFPPLIKLTITI